MSEEKKEDFKKEYSSTGPIDENNEDLKKEDQQSGPTDGKESDNFYKEELEKIKRERDNYKEGLLSKKEQIKKMKKEYPEFSKEEIEKIINDRINERVAEETNKFKEEFNREKFEVELDALTKDPDKRELIKYHYENSINLTGSIHKDLRRALLLADEKKIFSENEELKKSLSSKNSISNTSQGSSVKRDVPLSFQEVNLTQADKALLDRININRRKRGEKELTPQDIIKE